MSRWNLHTIVSITLITFFRLLTLQSEQAVALSTLAQNFSENNTQSVRFQGHERSITSVEFSPDGRRILTASMDGTARLWDASSSKLIAVFQGDGVVTSAEFSPDGTKILTAHDRAIKLWDTSGKLLAELRGDQMQGERGKTVGFSPNGKQILTQWGGEIYLWDDSGKRIKEFQIDKQEIITSVVFSPNSRQILIASRDKTAQLWDTSGKLLAEFRGHEGSVITAKFSPSGSQILTTSDDKTARLWDTSGKLLVIFRGNGTVINAEFSPNGNQILTTSEDQIARLWDTSGKLLTEIRGDGVIGAKFSPDGARILTLQGGGKPLLWDASGKLLAEFPDNEDGANIGVFSLDGNQVLTANSGGSIQLWNVSAAIYAYVPKQNVQEGIQSNQQGSAESRQQALQKLEEALKLYQTDNNIAKAAQTLLLMGNIQANLGQFQTALDSYNQALPLSKQAGVKPEEAAILNSLGQLYNNLADPKTALEYHNQALPLLYKLNDKAGAAATFNNIGNIQAATGEGKAALDSYNKALIISRPAGDLAAEATALTGIGSTYIASKQWSTALSAYNQALIISRNLKDKIKETTILNQQGKIQAALGENSTALNSYKQALTLAQQIGYKTEEANILYNQAILNRQQNNLTAAKTNIETAITIVEALRTQIGSQELRQSYFARNQDYYQFYIDLLMQLHQKNPNQGYDAIALNTSERARARTLLEQLTEASLNLKTNLDPTLLAEEKRLTQALNAADQKRNILSSSPSNEQLEATKTEINDIIKQLQNLEVQIRRANPAYANLKYPEPLKLEGIQSKILDDNTLLLQYALGQERSYLFLVSKTSLKTYTLPPKAEIEAAIEQYRELLQSPEFKDLSQGQQLSQMLLGQIKSELKGQRLVIIGNGKLQLLPFSALPSGSGAKAAPLLANHEIITLPSVTSLAVQREQWKKRQPAPKTLAMIADPVFKANDPRLGGKATTTNSGDLSKISSLRNSCGDFERLPNTETEAKEILSLVPDAQEFGALGFDANYATATNSNLSQYRIVHLATHGCIQDDPRFSNLALSSFNADGKKATNNSLKLQDIYNLELNADLVVLSACQTGTGKEVQGEGFIGLTQGFMYAGARRVAVSLWSVNDRATSILMADYYRVMLQQGLDPSAALRQAQLTMWQSGSYSAPFYWAAFTIQGDW